MMRSDTKRGRNRESSYSPSPSKVAEFRSWISSIIMDPRQILAAILTFTMFVMLGHMIKREHLDPIMGAHSSGNLLDFGKLEKQTVGGRNGLWKDDIAELKPCWTKPTSESIKSDGYVTFSLTDGPEYHISQITDAVVVARNLRAVLVLPDIIRESRLGDDRIRRSFGDVYDLKKFKEGVDGMIKVAEENPAGISIKNLAAVKVPNRVSENHIAVHIEPVFRSKGKIRLATYFPSLNMKKNEEKSESDAIVCQAMFGALELRREVREVVDLMVERLRTLSKKTEGRFVAIDLRLDILAKKGCKVQDSFGTKSCYNAMEVAVFLRKLGFGKDTTVYVTQSRWDNRLNPLKEYFPKTYTKEGIIMPEKKKDKYLEEAPALEEVIDFYVCSESDIFVPAISGLFYANVAGKRIASGRSEILVPSEAVSSFSPHEYMSHYVTEKNHLAYSCFC